MLLILAKKKECRFCFVKINIFIIFSFSPRLKKKRTLKKNTISKFKYHEIQINSNSNTNSSFSSSFLSTSSR